MIDWAMASEHLLSYSHPESTLRLTSSRESKLSLGLKANKFEEIGHGFLGISL